jgi:hypothetical protein
MAIGGASSARAGLSCTGPRACVPRAHARARACTGPRAGTRTKLLECGASRAGSGCARASPGGSHCRDARPDGSPCRGPCANFCA